MPAEGVGQDNSEQSLKSAPETTDEMPNNVVEAADRFTQNSGDQNNEMSMADIVARMKERSAQHTELMEDAREIRNRIYGYGEGADSQDSVTPEEESTQEGATVTNIKDKMPEQTEPSDKIKEKADILQALEKDPEIFNELTKEQKADEDITWKALVVAKEGWPLKNNPLAENLEFMRRVTNELNPRYDRYIPTEELKSEFRFGKRGEEKQSAVG